MGEWCCLASVLSTAIRRTTFKLVFNALFTAPPASSVSGLSEVALADPPSRCSAHATARQAADSGPRTSGPADQRTSGPRTAIHRYIGTGRGPAAPHPRFPRPPRCCPATPWKPTTTLLINRSMVVDTWCPGDIRPQVGQRGWKRPADAEPRPRAARCGLPGGIPDGSSGSPGVRPVGLTLVTMAKSSVTSPRDPSDFWTPSTSCQSPFSGSSRANRKGRRQLESDAGDARPIRVGRIR